MVLMGSALALHCGGMSVRRVGDQEGTGGTGDSDSGATGGAGAVAGTSPHPGSGGTGTGGGIPVGSGGSAAASGGTGGSTQVGGTGGSFHAGSGGGSGMASGTAGVPSVRECPTSQWNCNPLTCEGTQYAMPEHCQCDAELPKSVEECEPGEVFVCHAGGSTPEGTPTVLFGCSCMTPAADCYATCHLFAPEAGCLSESQSPGMHSILCGCAFVSLR